MCVFIRMPAVTSVQTQPRTRGARERMHMRTPNPPFHPAFPAGLPPDLHPRTCDLPRSIPLDRPAQLGGDGGLSLASPSSCAHHRSPSRFPLFSAGQRESRARARFKRVRARARVGACASFFFVKPNPKLLRARARAQSARACVRVRVRTCARDLRARACTNVVCARARV